MCPCVRSEANICCSYSLERVFSWKLKLAVSARLAGWPVSSQDLADSAPPLLGLHAVLSGFGFV